MHFAWGIGCGALITFVLVCYRIPDPPCPKLSWKCFIALIVGAIGATLYYWGMGFVNPITSIDFIAGSVAAVALGGFVYRIICPIK